MSLELTLYAIWSEWMGVHKKEAKKKKQKIKTTLQCE